MAVVLKMKLNDEIYRARLPVDDVNQVTFDIIGEAIEQVWPDLDNYIVRYVDAEGDYCTLVSASMTDFLTFAMEVSGLNVLKLEISVPEESTSEKGPVDTGSEDGVWKVRKDVSTNDFDGMDGIVWLLRPKKMMGYLSRMYAAGLLSGTMVGSLLAHVLPDLIYLVAEHRHKIDWKLKKKMRWIEANWDLQQVLSELQLLVSRTPGLEHCSEAVNTLASGTACFPSQALLIFLNALDSLKLESRIRFIESFFKSQECRLHTLLESIDAKMPWWKKIPLESLEHRDITCDACGITPLRGPRFQCTSCADYNLCSTCFAQKKVVHGGNCATHHFTCKVLDLQVILDTRMDAADSIAHKVMKRDCMLKGSSKGNFGFGMGLKGMGKGKRWWGESKGLKGKGKGIFWWSEGDGCKCKGKGKRPSTSESAWVCEKLQNPVEAGIATQLEMSSPVTGERRLNRKDEILPAPSANTNRDLVVEERVSTHHPSPSPCGPPCENESLPHTDGSLCLDLDPQCENGPDSDVGFVLLR
jgi:hypothetical protein|mmetsp:Transcript_23032/g.36768  ORF Transcript_23032/g.36768 Transcript_23032/m.36768 type:complete len:527 (+) Transcript_23032:125-1705(+)|eukprot:CAMPEP_0169104352 /NCGR_PEP_ID=MMETSP1015-20121227/23207_1 /TAXON_ID=342587 /ORGANISM="Karlodinium micrum, Strain CCMP2283" /LENGTH=526 /DNA_ID=CAMNT_0009165619 /DNA_START=112 /DNA_END=1692 /DNA_ORIENTATION=+